MSFVYRFFAIIYRTYDDRGIDIPHFRMLATVVFMLFLHVVHVGLLFNLSTDDLFLYQSEGKRLHWLSFTIYFVAPVLVLAIVFNKKKLDEVSVTQKQINRGRTVLPIYMTLSIVLMVILLIRHGINKGTIDL